MHDLQTSKVVQFFWPTRYI